jgi:hypothetical protein
MMAAIGRTSGNWAYRAGIGVAAMTAFLTVWITIVRDDGTGLPFFMVVLAAPVAAFAAGFRASGMARAMTGVAVMQALLAAGIATAPDGTSKALIASVGLTAFWLASAAFFWTAAKAER